MISILERAEGGDHLSKGDLLSLLSTAGVEESEALFAAARRARARTTGNRVFLYGFVYLSTHCRQDCHFCFYRRSNTRSPRYRKTTDQVVEVARTLADSNVHLIDLTMGEDPAYLDGDGPGELANLVASVRAVTGLPVMISPGVVDEEVLSALKKSGAEWYACYQETHNRSLFREIRPSQPFDARMEGKRAARELGFLTEEGILSGVGETSQDVVESLAAMKELASDQVRVMSFIPQTGTPFARRPPGKIEDELKVIAILRLVFPDRLIPASLDVSGLEGLKARLRAGANVVTSLVPPGEGLAGVAQSRLDIEESRRTVESVGPVLRACGLQAATRGEYRRWMDERMGQSVGAP
ncbi:MAG: methylornithine synthase PylB [Gemmatimonadetes bacterium]|nr:methylornithine synthase PylB [Gemmatimonadota bacterium]NNM03692.1 methylornithine synthase PylB [Gemmatimonadota bacterium]